jgi:hypothetical protein
MQNNKNIEEFTSDFFDNASYEWRKNKIRLSEGTFKYRCCFTTFIIYICEKMRENQGISASLMPTNKSYFCSKHLRTKFNPEIHKFEN